MGLMISVRVATTHWLGQELHTPSHSPDEMEAAIKAWCLLRNARGPTAVGGRGLLWHISREEADATWSRVRSTYLDLCHSRGLDCKRLDARLSMLAAARSRHREREADRWLRGRQILAERMERKRERRLMRLSDRTANQELQLLQRYRRAAVARSAHDARAMTTLMRLLARWSAHESTVVARRAKKTDRV